MFSVLFAAVGYGVAFHYAYLTYLNVDFEYAGFTYGTPSTLNLALTYILIAAPMAAYRKSTAPSSYGAALVAAICYIPAQLIMLFVWRRSSIELAFVQISVAMSMAVILWVSTAGWEERTSSEGEAALPIARLELPNRLSGIVAALTVASSLAVLYGYGRSLQIVSFDDIYDLRFEVTQADKSPIVNYSLTWLIYCFTPFYFARGLLRRNLIDLGIGFLGGLLVYAAIGLKTGILMGVIVGGLYIFVVYAGNFLLTLLISLAVIVVVVASLPGDEGPVFWLKSILLVRVLSTGGWTMAAYYDFFASNGFTWYTHIGIINAITGAYPYGDLAPGQLIGLQYSNSEEANFNAGFWASDAFAAIGVGGVPIATLAVCAVFTAINRTSRGYSHTFIVLWLSGFWHALLNVPLSTSLLSGGGLLVMLLLELHSPRTGQSEDAESTQKQVADDDALRVEP